MGPTKQVRVAIACQGGGSHTAFTSGVLQTLLAELPGDVSVVAISGTSGGAMCAALAWDGLVRGDTQLACRKLQKFWEAISASEPWDQILNQALLNLVTLRNYMVLPEVSPYMVPPWGEDRFRAILEQHFNFAELRELAKKKDAPALQIGAVEVLTGHFEVFTGVDLCVESLLASAAIPEMFRAVQVPGKGAYWDGLFSQNPPIHDLTDHNIHELWLIQINPSTCARVPVDTHEIVDRRNELSGNLAMEQELNQIAQINRLIALGHLSGTKYHPIQVHRIRLEQDLDYSSKLDRRPAFLEELRQYGHAQARWFLDERAGDLATAAALGSSRRAGAKSR